MNKLLFLACLVCDIILFRSKRFLEKGNTMSEIEKRIADVRKRMEDAKKRSPYKQDVTLIAVTKFHSLAEMEEAIDCGITYVGENRIQEMEQKYRLLQKPVHWNLQGHLQKNKVKKAIAMDCLIHSGDSLSILKEINKRAAAIGKVQDVLLEFNISGEETKHGLKPEEFEEAVQLAKELPNICVRGLMCMAPEEGEDVIRPVFKKGHEMWEKLKECFPKGQISILSMGMSGDFEIAIEEGSNMVRVGTAIFGARDYTRGVNL